MRGLERCCTALCLVAWLSLSTAAHAQQAAADALFDEGRKLMEAGRYEDAIPKMRDSNRVDPAPGTLLNLAECYAKTRRTASAWSTYKDAAALAATQGQKDRERFASEHADALRASLSTVTVVVPNETRVNGLTVVVNGGPVPESLYGQAFPVDPGTVRLDASAPGKTPVSASGELRDGGATLTFNVAPLVDAAGAAAPSVPPPAPAPAPSSVPPAEADSSEDPGATQKVVAFVLGGAGIVGLAVGTGLYVRAENTISDAHCPNLTCVEGASDPALHEKGRSEEKVAVGVGLTGALLLATGVTLYFTAPSASSDAARFGVRVASGERGGLSLAATGRF